VVAFKRERGKVNILVRRLVLSDNFIQLYTHSLSCAKITTPGSIFESLYYE